MTSNEKGLAMATVLVLSVIALAVMAALIYLVTQGTRFSGSSKRYETAREAAVGGTDVVTAIMNNQGNLVIPAMGINLPTTCTCSPINPFDLDNIEAPDPDTCLCEKLCLPTYKSTGVYNWKNCTTTAVSITDPVDSADIQFLLPANPLFGEKQYRIFGKIVDTSVGSTGLGAQVNETCGGVVNSNCEPPQTQPMPYLYRIEITARDESKNTPEMARFSILYAR